MKTPTLLTVRPRTSIPAKAARRSVPRMGAGGLRCGPAQAARRVPGALGEREEALIEAGDIVGASELMVETWLGPDADATAREAVRHMQRHAFELQPAAAEEFEPVEAVVEPAAIHAPCLVLSGAHDLADFRRSLPGCRICSRTPTTSNCPGQVTFPAWSGHRPLPIC
ncbi:hypothetical protein ACFVAQ_20470 [Streptomyces sp. NPDC057651]|uniref:hypothetical protein n=1 Tax=unclassified Streptomyces TaxID=2593676 RepID=UPI0036A92F1C